MNIINHRSFAALIIFSFLAMSQTKGFAQEAKAPATAEQHLALAKQYDEKATAFTKEADYHRQMSDAYKTTVPTNKSGQPNPWVVKMEKHCMAIVKNAEKLAGDMKTAAEFHRLRAKEFEGK